MSSTEHANEEKHYLIIVVAVIVGVFGLYIRFADIPYSVIIGNILLVIGVLISLKGVFGILE